MAESTNIAIAETDVTSVEFDTNAVQIVSIINTSQTIKRRFFLILKK